MKRLTPRILALYAVIVLVGGCMGYFKAGSLLSLATGGLSGVLLLLCAFLYARGKQGAPYAAAVITGILAFFFLYRFLKTGALFPAAFMSLLSLSMLYWLWTRGSR